MFLKKSGAFLISFIITFIVYLMLVRMLTSLFPQKILFFGACLISIITSLLTIILCQLFSKNSYDTFNAVLLYLVSALLLIVFTIMGPAFIDRSISYHIVFYATEKNNIKIEEMEDVFAHEIFEKRINDELKAGMIESLPNGTYCATTKAKVISFVLLLLGKVTGTLGTYNDMKNKIAAKQLT